MIASSRYHTDLLKRDIISSVQFTVWHNINEQEKNEGVLRKDEEANRRVFDNGAVANALSTTTTGSTSQEHRRTYKKKAAGIFLSP